MSQVLVDFGIGEPNHAIVVLQKPLISPMVTLPAFSRSMYGTINFDNQSMLRAHEVHHKHPNWMLPPKL